ncbi:GL22499 [Drosophila persimilis]|uniref:protein-serine/threonine phosphatase n=1 Tax=Drosophila persimilis TaxID=7234 RepID=B4H1D9_DROPE|nr:probable protein phosphatase 2C T23F11.1 [Drosophila persimilis]EDW30116.1 GL22499 [Drosophila persimilis]
MGQTLSKPVTTKNTVDCENSVFRVGSSSMQGWRTEMEDADTIILSLPEDPTASFFGVYDGHGGAAVAKFAGLHLHQFITKRREYFDNAVVGALKSGFLDFDKEIIQNGSWQQQIAGSTAVVVLIKEQRLYCANAGDSRAIASIGGKVRALSWDHKPQNEEERSRILAGGGFIEFNRVNGSLALSRAFGDCMYKRNMHMPPEQQIVTAYPDVEVADLTEDWEFVVLACDGIWDVMSNQEVCDFVRKRLAAGMTPECICEELLNSCLATDFNITEVGGDNMTAILVCFLHNKTFEDLVVRCGGTNQSPTVMDSSKSIWSDI